MMLESNATVKRGEDGLAFVSISSYFRRCPACYRIHTMERRQTGSDRHCTNNTVTKIRPLTDANTGLAHPLRAQATNVSRVLPRGFEPQKQSMLATSTNMSATNILFIKHFGQKHIVYQICWPHTSLNMYTCQLFFHLLSISVIFGILPSIIFHPPPAKNILLYRVLKYGYCLISKHISYT